MGNPDTLPGYSTTRIQQQVVAEARPRIHGPADLVALVRDAITDPDREHFFGAYLSTKNHLLALELISLGSLSASIVHPREIYKPALLHSAGALLVAHNHPSGDPEPSAEDQDFTRRLYHAGELLGIRLLDHVILGHDTYVSLKERGTF